MWNYLKEVNAESKNIKWPTKKVTALFTLGVIFVSFMFALYIGLLDFVFVETVNRTIIKDKKEIKNVTNDQIEDKNLKVKIDDTKKNNQNLKIKFDDVKKQK